MTGEHTCVEGIDLAADLAQFDVLAAESLRSFLRAQAYTHGPARASVADGPPGQRSGAAAASSMMGLALIIARVGSGYLLDHFFGSGGGIAVLMFEQRRDRAGRGVSDRHRNGS